jgi:hypothetical protein
VQLQRVELPVDDCALHRLVIGIDEHPDLGDVIRHARGKLLRTSEIEVPRRWREEDETDVAGAMAQRSVERFGRGQAADLGVNGHVAAPRPLRWQVQVLAGYILDPSESQGLLLGQHVGQPGRTPLPLK